MRLGAQRDAEVDQPLAAVGKIATLDVLDAFQTEELHQLGRLAVNLAAAVDVAPGIAVPAVARLPGEPTVLVDREARDAIGDLARQRERAQGNGGGRQDAKGQK